MTVHEDSDSVKSAKIKSAADTTADTGITIAPADSLSTPPDCPSTAASTTCVITPSNIHINYMYAYNFTPEQAESNSSTIDNPSKKTSKYQSPAASSGPICRICHEGDCKEDLVSLCRCAGTVGLVHKTCMETWLSTRCNTKDKCEICNYSFATVRYPKSVYEWIRCNENNAYHRRSLMRDFTCFLILTPLAIVGSFLCIKGAKSEVWKNSLEGGCFMALFATSIITVYFVWNLLAVRYHMKCYYLWRSKNQNVKLLCIQRVSVGAESCSSDSNCVEIISNGLENPESQNIAIEITPEEIRIASDLPVFNV